jgi:ATP/maltotriose-dependent transcriptional regulator MalT/DNA-binding SARP family transcriptional activator
MRIMRAIAAAAPGASDALAERLVSGPEQFDPLVATRELIAELDRLLVEPLVLVIDDAEHLDGAAESLRLLGELLRAEQRTLRVALATRRPLDLRLAKPRAAGRLTEIHAADLAFDPEECAKLLRERTGIDPAPEQVEEMMRATEGWPLGIALAAALAEQRREAGAAASLDDLGSAPDMRSYLSEEFLDSLNPDLRLAAIRSSVARVVTPAVAAALGLPEDFDGRIERAGMLVRELDGAKGFAYHPLLRELLRDRLRAQCGDDELRRLHEAAAPAVAESGDAIGAIDHWLQAASWDEAVAAVERAGPRMIRTSPELMQHWLSLLPPDVRGRPAIRTLEGQLEWSAGQHERAVEPLRDAVAGHHEAEDPEREWLARYFLAEALFSAGGFEEMLELAEGWDRPGTAHEHMGAVGVAWYAVLALTALGRRAECERLASRLRRDPKSAPRFRYFDDFAALLADVAAGRSDATLTEWHATIDELELNDPQNRLPVTLAVAGLVHRDIGEISAAIDCFERSRRESQRLGLGFVTRDAHLQHASLLAQHGELADAELELERAGRRQDSGWRSVSRPTAEAFVAAARGDAAEAVAAARRALVRVQPGLVCYRVWAALDMAMVLAENGAPDLARKAIDEARTALDEQFPGELGRYHRARLIAARAWLEYSAGERDEAYESLRLSLNEAGDGAHQVARAHWTQLRPILWQALADRAIELSTALDALERALPRGEALIAFADHPEPSVRRAAVSAALASNHPGVLSDLAKLDDDADEQVAAVAAATRERLRRSPPALTFTLLGPFEVARGGWELGAASWQRPLDARLVRVLLVHGGRPVSEDVIFEALWPKRSVASARDSLHVAVSRARRVLDLPGAERSVIESAEQAYRLDLEHAVVDAEAFRAAAELALTERGADQAALLERARSLWGGEPLPEERYSDWATAYRERLIDRHVAVLSALVQLREHAGDHAGAADLARELVDIDPLNEGAHRALIVAYARTGRTGHALRQYLECRRALVEGLGIEPSAATSRLQARVLAGERV